MSPKCPFRINAVPPINAMTDMGADNCHADGATDDTAHLQAAMAAAVAAGKRLYLPAGTYHLHVTAGQNYALLLPSNLYMYGDGVTTILSHHGGQALRTNTQSGITLRDFKLVGDYSTADYGIVAGTSAASWTLTNLTVQDFVTTGIYGYAWTATTMTGLTVSHCGDWGIEMKDGSNGVTLTNCLAHTFEGLSNAPHGFYPKNSQNIYFNQCTSYGATRGPTGQGVGGWQMTNCNNVILTECNSYDHLLNFDGYGYISNGTGNHTYHDCTGSGNYYDVGELYYSGTATYQDMSFPPLTKRVLS